MSRRRRTKSSTKAKLIVVVAVLIALGLTTTGVTVEDAKNTVIALGVMVGILFVLSFILNIPSVKGKRGERKIAKLLNSIVSKNGGFVINDVIVPSENGATSQIDHIVFAKGGIFVIETKNYSGRIYGTDDQREWTQVLAYGKKKNRFYSPVKQNQTHIYRLKEVLGNSYKLTSCVVFLRADISFTESEYLFTPSELKRYLKVQANQEIISAKELEDAYQKILHYKENPVQSTKEHVKEIKENMKKIAKNICPRCGGELVLRHSKDGNSFYGCSNYPKCKFTKKV